MSGDPDVDAAAVRYFVAQGFTTFICQSFSKNFGLYSMRQASCRCLLMCSLTGERVGNLTFVGATKEITNAISTQAWPSPRAAPHHLMDNILQVRVVIRQLWSNPPQHGARIVTTVLTSAALRAQWYGTQQVVGTRLT